MITVITMYEENPETGKEELVVSHGVEELGRNVCLPSEHPSQIGAVYDERLMEYVLPDTPPAAQEISTAKVATSAKPKPDWFEAEYGGNDGPGM
jgi:hypothetical protein